jgi:predicted Rossmann fold nucleotide-binding protein DprA/Smf involved in DNA uptake
MVRTGATREHYQKQKSQAYAYFRVSGGDAVKVDSGQFTLYDFITNLFSYSSAKRDLAVSVLDRLRQEPQTFQQLVQSLQAKKSTLYLLCLSLERSGLVEREGGKRSVYKLSRQFSGSLAAYSGWWGKWSQETGRQTAQP